MLMPADMREDLLVLFAFNHEIAKTREVVSETMLGQIRLKWWLDALQGIYDGGSVPENDILRALADVIARRGLSFSYFETLICAREFDLEDVLPGNIEGFVNYCDFTLSPLLCLAMQIMGDDPQEEPVQAVAVNYAYTGLSRAIPFHARQRRCYLPEDLMAKYGQSVNALYDLKPAEKLPELVRELGGVYAHRLAPQNKFLKASHILSKIYYGQIKGAGFDMFSRRLAIEPPFKALRLAFCYKFL